METIDEETLAPLLRGKPQLRQAAVLEMICEAVAAGRLKISGHEDGILHGCLDLMTKGREVPTPIFAEVNRLVRHYEQHLIAAAARAFRNIE